MLSRRLAGVLVLTLLSGCSSSREPVERIVLITIDTLRWDHVGYTGYDVATPNLDRLARSGAVFENAVTAAPITLPAHCSMLTGFYPPAHGIRNNGMFRLSDDVETVAEVLNDAGFATGAFIGAFVLDRRFGLEQGFDHYNDELPDENPLHSAYFAERPAEEVVQATIDWIRSRDHERFFVWIHVFDPHRPFNAPSPYSEQYPNRPYDAEIAYTDHALGPLTDTVTAIDGGNKTAIIVTADHGESLGEHGETSHSFFVYDATMRVPLILSGPGIPAGTRVDQQVRTVDIAPTILELAGLKPKAAIEGVSLLRYLQSGESSSLSAYGETFAPRLDYNWSELRFLRKDGFKFIDAPRRELYDLNADPKELVNLWSENPPAVGKRLASELENLKGASGGDEFDSSIEIDEETRRRLESLGYVGTRASSSGEIKERSDPKDRIEVYEKMQTLLGAELSADEKIEAYRELLAMEPTNVLARQRLANKLSEEDRFEEAVEEYRELIRVSEIGSKGLENLGVALLLLDRTEEALEVTQRAVEELPWNLDLHVLRGEALEKAGQLEEAIEAYEKAVELRSEDPENYWRRGAVAVKQGDHERAEHDFLEALAKDASFHPAMASLSRLLVKDGRAEEAIRMLTSSSKDELDKPEIKAALAEAYLATGRFGEARALLEDAHAEVPENTRVLALLGPVYGHAGELHKAAETLQKALSLGETDPEVRRNLALVYIQQKKPQAAIAELRSASRDAPQDASIWFTLGNALLRTRDDNGAAAAFEKALELRPDWPQATFNKALAYERAGMPRKAAEAYRRFLASGALDAQRRAEAERRLARLQGGGSQ